MNLIGRRLLLLRALIEATALLKRGDQERLRLLALEVEALPPDAESLWNAIPLCLTFWWIVSFQNEGASLIPRLLLTKQVMMEEGDRLFTISIMTGLAFAYTRAAQWHLAQQECLAALSLIEQSGIHTSLAGYLYHFLFQVSYTRNQLREAAAWLQHLRSIAQDWQSADLLIRGALLSGRLELATGAFSAANLSLYQLEALIEQEGVAIHTSWWIARRVQWWLAVGNLAEASGWAAQLTLSPETWNPRRKGEVLMLVRVQLAQQHYTRALEILERWNQLLDSPGDSETTIDFLALQVVALYHAEKRAQAAHVAARLLAMTEPEGYLRVYLDLGTPMKQALLGLLTFSHQRPEQAHHELTASSAFVTKLLAAFEIEEQQGHTSVRAKVLPEHLSADPGERPSTPPAPVTSLTRREQEVLRLLAEGASNQEISTILVIQLSTVKKHVSNLLWKLGAASRTQAIIQARALSLL